MGSTGYSCHHHVLIEQQLLSLLEEVTWMATPLYLAHWLKKTKFFSSLFFSKTLLSKKYIYLIYLENTEPHSNAAHSYNLITTQVF